MKKDTREKNVYYSINWSRLFAYDKYEARRVLPELPGIIWIQNKIERRMETSLFYACWRDGLRVGFSKLMDDLILKHNDIREKLIQYDMFYKYCVIDTNPKDIRDVMFWLIKEYKPILNDNKDFQDSKRYMNIFVKEIEDKA
ncbi:MAG: hypothetical protein FWF73_05715 [Spirochaetes bacterium]|nr:hypothetical protein [Spirochaetota bacterium]